MNGTGVSDFWAEVSSFETIRTRSARGKKGVRQADFFIDRVTLGQLTATNASLNEMQDAIQQVRQAHVASLVSLLSPARRRRRRSDDNPDPSFPPPLRQSRLDTTPNSAAARETDGLIAFTRQLTASNKNKIQALNKLAKDKTQKQQVQAAKSRFMGLLQEYQTVEKEFRKKVKERGERQFKIGECSSSGACRACGAARS